MLGSLLIATLLYDTNQDSIHPAFIKDPSVLVSSWDRGWKDAEKKRDANSVLNKFRKGIGDIRTTAFKHETVSWFWVSAPEVVTYFTAFDSRKKYRPEGEVAKLKEALTALKEPQAMRQLEVFGVLNIYPSFDNNGSVSRPANPSSLEDVRVVLKVADKIFQPVEQPGNITQRSGSGQTTVTDVHTAVTRGSGSTSGSGSVNGSPVWYSSSSSGRAVTTYTTNHGESYDWFSGSFSVAFDLYNEDGTPRIKDSDKEITFIVVYGNSERRATYKLSELQDVKT